MKKLLLSLSALLVASVTALSAGAAELQGNPEAGAKKNAMCIGCHGIVGYQASFPEIHKVPMISGQSAGYIVAALNAYKAGDRKHESMRGIAASLSDQDIADLAAYYAASGAKEGAAELPKAPEANAKVQELLTKSACASCHGDNFSKPMAGAPKIAGQHADYLFVALKSYKQTNNPHVGRSNGVMGGIVKPLSNAELKAVANYLGGLPGEMKVVPQARFK